MKKSIFVILFLLANSGAFGQKGKFNVFKLIVIKPDTAIIDKSLYSDIDGVQPDYQRRYYSSLKQMEELLNFTNYPKNMESQFKEEHERLIKEVPLMKAQESEVKKFRYFETLSSYSAEVYNFYYNEYEPFSKIAILPSQKTDIVALKNTADTAQADYIIFFSNVHTETKGYLPKLKLTTSLYSKQDNQILLTTETEGDTNSRGDMWTCGSTVLSCLLINGVRTSTDAVAPVIAKRQLRK